MQDILDIIVDNPIIMAVILGVISLIFNKLGKNDDNEEAKRKKTPERPKTEAPKNAEKRQKTTGKAAAQPAAAQKSTDMVRELERIKTDVERSMPAVERALKKQSGRPPKPAQHVIELNQNTVVQGIVLSEVLGPPRSRKPHHTMRRRP
ncbi:hypothetical protein N1I81_13745 [Bacillus sp. FSL M8-0052]|uniref:hypothetical protein n=1 Tax=Bacillus sp. IG6 TaxID=3075934 RepID=UPI0008151469|nr:MULTISPECIES: hypothetical protein [Bacillus]MDU0072198.1 hypothetical protein [Bacillus sp. IG6]MED8019743.1 hypothetical protein [Bacillus glycinifermentans]WKB75802.1 hypothetical protein QYM22_15395 [Bacillus glycinifermentans]SCA86816.1 hypothetical protein BGLY_2993 [Bacillus glycinifermentans]